MKQLSKLSWVDRFSIIDHLNPTDDAICEVFGVSAYELQAAREVRSHGHLRMASTVNPRSFEEMFMSKKKATESATVITNPAAVTKEAPETISKEADGAKAKTGPKTSKIHTAFSNIPGTPTPAEAFSKQYGVSIAVLRQHKRFDSTGQTGRVNVRKDKASGSLMVWRGE